LAARAERAVAVRLAHESSAVEHTLARVRAMSPKATLERGYAILVSGDGTGVNSVAEVTRGEELAAYLTDGRLRLAVTDITAGLPGAP
jgi:exodeoxyribonuclease VII large subunit